MKITVRYFASLRDQSGCESELIDVVQINLGDLFDELAARYHFSWKKEQLRVAINQTFGSWQQSLSDGDEVVFIPPVSGG